MDSKVRFAASPYWDLPVAYASSRTDRDNNTALLGRLLRTVTESDPFPGYANLPSVIEISKDKLGKPFAVQGAGKGPSVSFSHSRAQTWAAISFNRNLGIDAAHPDEFTDPYPFERVFRTREFVLAADACCCGTADAAALLWAVKEASVKALGWGFYLIDPIDVEILEHRILNGENYFTVKAGMPLEVWAGREDTFWLSIAVLNKTPSKSCA